MNEKFIQHLAFKIQHSSRAHIKIPQRIIQARFQISTGFALANDQGTTYIVFACRKFFHITSRDHYASCRHPALVFFRFIATYINDLC